MKVMIMVIAGLMLWGVEAQDKPNILFIFADDQTFESIGALNNEEIKTPNLDRLMKGGVSFTHTFNQGSWSPAICVASRAMIITGSFVWKAARFDSRRNSMTIEQDRNAPRSTIPYLVEKAVPDKYWPEYMKEAGYETYFSGKWHIQKKVEELFDHVSHVRGGMPGQTQKRYDRKFLEEKPDEWTPFDQDNGGFWAGGKHWSEVLSDDAQKFLSDAKISKNPFFMYLAFNAPHDPRQSPKEYVDMYPLDKISVPETFMPQYPYCEEAGSGPELRDEMLAPFPRTEYSVKVNRQEYYAIITHMDYQIGRILSALKKTGKMDNTYIFFTADHGLAVGDHGFIGKQNMYDRSIRVPMFISGPNIPKGKKIDNLVYLQDIMPTTLQLAGVDKPEHIDFNSLLPLIEGKSQGYKAIFGSYMGNQRMIRTKDHKMIIYPTANMVRLYNLIEDPNEMKDLAGIPENKKLMDTLFESYKKLQKEVGDPLDMTKYYNNFFHGTN